MEISVIQLHRPFAFTSPYAGQEFALLLLVVEPSVTPEEQRALSAAFVEQGCRFAVCTGVECDSWDDSIDYADVLAEIEGTRPGTPLVMTTWHESASIEEVVHFFLNHTCFEDFVAQRGVAVVVGGADHDLRSVTQALHVQGSEPEQRSRGAAGRTTMQ